MDNKEKLAGGRIGKIHKVGKTVVRPYNTWTDSVHRFLKFIIEEGADFVPVPYGLNANGEEVISYMPGEVFNYPLPAPLRRDSMIVSSAGLLRRFHDYSEKYIPKLTDSDRWMLPASEPFEVMCHGDYAPYNVTIIDNEAAGIIDFDTLHPGTRIWDIAYGIYRWVPFKNPGNPDGYGDLNEQIRKAKLFLDSYGLDKMRRGLFVSTIIQKLNNLVAYMRTEAETGNEDFQLNIKDGHHKLYLEDIEYLKKNQEEIDSGIK